MVAASNYDSKARPILKPCSLEDELYISTSKKSWKALPVPRYQQIQETFESQQFVSRKPTETTRRRRVSFGEIQLRQYAQTVGDHPCTAIGPPISLDWQYNEGESISVDEYESKVALKPKRNSLILSDSRRRKVLTQRYGCELEDIKTAIIERRQTARQREQSAKSKLYEKLENPLKNVKLNAKKLLRVRVAGTSA